MRLLVLICVAASFFATTHSAHSQSSDAALQCSGSTTTEQRECLEKFLAGVTDAINSVYEEYRKTLSQEDRAAIKAVQVFWIKYRDAACQFESSAVEGGSMRSTVYLLCQISYTEERLSRLGALLKCDSGVSPGGSCSR